MFLNDLLAREGINSENVVVFRHRPHERELRRVLPWLAAEKPDVFNAYQQTHGPRVQNTLEKLIGKGYVASFIGIDPGQAEFVGLYRIEGAESLSYKEFWQVPAYIEMKAFGMVGWADRKKRTHTLFFDLVPTDFYSLWKGRLIIGWPGPERSWWRRAHKNDFPILAVREESGFSEAMPNWNEINLTWEELQILPLRWRNALSQWRAIYYIFDSKNRKGYVGSAYGENNLLGRWLNYASVGHGWNKLLRNRDPRKFHFSILERVSPDMDPADVIRLESTWKDRLHTRSPEGMNDN